MAIYVDALKKHPSGIWCHMMTDSSNLRELHMFAESIGLKRHWFQDGRVHPHYDLRPVKRQLAMENGAIAVSSVEMVRKCSYKEKRK